MAKILVVDDNPIVQSVLKFLIEEHFADCRVDEAIDGESSIEKIERNDYDLVMIDINMPDVDSVDHVFNLLTIQPGLKILMFGIDPEAVPAQRCLGIGSMGYLAKNDSEKEITTAVKRLLQNKKYISPRLTRVSMSSPQINESHDPSIIFLPLLKQHSL